MLTTEWLASLLRVTCLKPSCSSWIAPSRPGEPHGGRERAAGWRSGSTAGAPAGRSHTISSGHGRLAPRPAGHGVRLAGNEHRAVSLMCDSAADTTKDKIGNHTMATRAHHNQIIVLGLGDAQNGLRRWPFKQLGFNLDTLTKLGPRI